MLTKKQKTNDICEIKHFSFFQETGENFSFCLVPSIGYIQHMFCNLFRFQTLTDLHWYDTIGWFRNRMGTSVDDCARQSNYWLDQWQSSKLRTGSHVPFGALSSRQLTFLFGCLISSCCATSPEAKCQLQLIYSYSQNAEAKISLGKCWAQE